MDPMREKLDLLVQAGWKPVRPGEKRTTPPPPVNILEYLPELADQARTTVRLHPRFCPDLPKEVSKIGGDFLWPADEPWPVCWQHQQPYLTVMQLRRDEFPEMPFPEGNDLFQWLWCPYQTSCLRGKFFWRNAREIEVVFQNQPSPTQADVWNLPMPCAFLPERVAEYPPLCMLSKSQRERLRSSNLLNLLKREPWAEFGIDDPVDLYQLVLSVCPATKIGGYPQFWSGPSIERQNSPSTYLLTIAGEEFGTLDWTRWAAEEDCRYWKQGVDAPDFNESKLAVWAGQFGNPIDLFAGRIDLWVDASGPVWRVEEDPSFG
jgi:hypothetical protein